jgi:hypothetical protein
MAKKAELDRMALSAATDCYLSPAVVIGGYGHFGTFGNDGEELCLGDSVSVRFTEEEMRIRLDEHPDQPVVAMPFSEVRSLEISGGVTRSGGGVIGGGFGIEGALQGMAIASVLNALTTSTNVSTTVHIDTERGELFFHTALIAPQALRLALSPAIWRLAHRNH